jgi:hypothetical protein
LGLGAWGFPSNESQRLEKILANLEDQFFGACVSRECVDTGQVDEQLAGREEVASKPRRNADRALHVNHFEPAVVEQLLHAPRRGNEVVGVINIPEEAALFEVVRHHHEEISAGLQRAQRLSRELSRIVDPAHVLEDLIGIDHISDRVGHRKRRRPRFDHFETLLAKDVDQERAGFDRGVLPAGRDGKFAERTVTGPDLEHRSRRRRVALEQRQAMTLDSRSAAAAKRSELFFGERLVESVFSQGVSRWPGPCAEPGGLNS